MKSLMMDSQLSILSLMEHCENNYSDTQVCSRRFDGEIERNTYAEVFERTRMLASALSSAGVKPGSIIATFGQNHLRHFELYYAITCLGAVCHTINPRLSDSVIAYIIDHADDMMIFFDVDYKNKIEAIVCKLNKAPRLIEMNDCSSTEGRFLDYESFIAGHKITKTWPELDERQASGLCYTSGTTGHPKGVLYSHRATVLHAMTLAMANNFAITASDCVLPLVPMYHVNAWGLPFLTVLTGAKLVLPGLHLDPASIYQLIETEKVTFIAGVPTILEMLLNFMIKNSLKFSSLKVVAVGGSAASENLISTYREEHQVEVIHAWGMTEVPQGTAGRLVGDAVKKTPKEQAYILSSQGRPLYGVEMRLVGDSGQVLPRNSVAGGHLQVRGPWSCRSYFKSSATDSHSEDGWLVTGDIANFDAQSYLRITDRSKDVIKSGGEWISSIDIENAAMSCTGVLLAAAISIPDPKWQERPLLIVKTAGEVSEVTEALWEVLKVRLERWQLPVRIEFTDHIPLGATGKINKLLLREEYQALA